MIRNSIGEADSGDVCAVGRGSNLIFSTKEKWVVRHFESPVVDDQYLQRRAEVSQYLPCCEMLEVLGTDCFRETLVIGRSVRDTCDSERGAILKRLWEAGGSAGHAWHQRSDGARPSGYQTALTAVPRGSLPPKMTATLSDFTLTRFILSAAYPTSHGDLWEDNIIVVDSGFLILDLDPRCMGPRPFWFDAVTAIMLKDAFHNVALNTEVAASASLALELGGSGSQSVRADLTALAALWSLLMAAEVRNDALLSHEVAWKKPQIDLAVNYWKNRPTALR